jgi:hypothetical protein
MSAIQDLIAAALRLTAIAERNTDDRDEWQHSISEVREMCARAMVQPDGWQPIETAPKDTDVILYCKRIGVVCGRWSDERYAGNPRPYWKHDKTHLFGIKQTREDQPTHWMPKPDAPK